MILFLSRTLDFGGRYDTVNFIISIAVLTNFIATVSMIIITIWYIEDFVIGQTVFASLGCVTLLFFSLWMFIYGARLQLRLMNHSYWQSSDFLKKIRELIRINAVLTVCTLCYMSRAITLILLVLWDEHLTDLKGPSNFVWFLASQWIPNFIPVRWFYLLRFRNLV